MQKEIDFIGIGPSKTGTTTIARLLEAHPQICLSVPKEIFYFNKTDVYWSQSTENPNHNKSTEWYFNHFKHCQINSTKGEITPNYFIDSEAPKKIKEIFPNAKIIVSLRNPVDRAYSSYNMIAHYHLGEQRPFSQVIREVPEYVEKGLYYKNINKYLQYFDRSQIIVLTFEEIKNDPKKMIQKLYSFLGVDDSFTPENLHLKANSAKKTQYKWMQKLEHQMVKNISGWGGGKFINWLKEKKVNKWFHSLYVQPMKYEPMKEVDRNWLKEQFREDLEQLEKLLGRDFSHWK